MFVQLCRQECAQSMQVSGEEWKCSSHGDSPQSRQSSQRSGMISAASPENARNVHCSAALRLSYEWLTARLALDNDWPTPRQALLIAKSNFRSFHSFILFLSAMCPEIKFLETTDQIEELIRSRRVSATLLPLEEPSSSFERWKSCEIFLDLSSSENSLLLFHLTAAYL